MFMQANTLPVIFGLGMFVFIAEKVLKESGRGDMAFIITFGGFIVGLTIIIKMITDIINLTYNSFRF